jgi:hypothetical protein
MGNVLLGARGLRTYGVIKNVKPDGGARRRTERMRRKSAAHWKLPGFRFSDGRCQCARKREEVVPDAYRLRPGPTRTSLPGRAVRLAPDSSRKVRCTDIGPPKTTPASTYELAKRNPDDPEAVYATYYANAMPGHIALRQGNRREAAALCSPQCATSGTPRAFDTSATTCRSPATNRAG